MVPMHIKSDPIARVGESATESKASWAKRFGNCAPCQSCASRRSSCAGRRTSSVHVFVICAWVHTCMLACVPARVFLFAKMVNTSNVLSMFSNFSWRYIMVKKRASIKLSRLFSFSMFWKIRGFWVFWSWISKKKLSWNGKRHFSIWGRIVDR